MSGNPLEPGQLDDRLAGLGWVRRVVVLDVLDSTNTSARELAREGAPAGTVVVADAQAAGRGRVGRRWFSRAGLGLYVSVLFRPTASTEDALRWTLASAVAAGDAVRAVSGVEAEIKWPNDLLVGGLKLAGTLVEMRSAGRRVRELVVGTGINVHHRRGDFPRELRGSATSLALEAPGRLHSRTDLLARYVKELGQRAAQLEAGGWEDLRRDWERQAPMSRGVDVRVTQEGETEPVEGRTEGVDDQGALLVRSRSGRIVPVRLHQRLERT